MPQEYTVRFRRATAARWASRNPVLDLGEPGYERDTGRMKIGKEGEDGKPLPWNSLGYFYPGEDAVNAGLEAHRHSINPHPEFDQEGPSLVLLYRNKKV